MPADPRCAVRLAAVVGMLAVLCGCGGGDETTASGTPSPSTSATGSPSVSIPSTPNPTTALKPALHGLIDRSAPPPASLSGVVDAYVVNLNWSDVQPSPGDLVHNNPLDQAISAVRQMNASPGAHPLAIKVRFYAGIHAPDWAKQLGGGPVQVFSSEGSGTVGRFWTDAFGAAYADVWQRLAQRYDGVPEIREITVSRCMTVFAETFIRDTSDPTTVQDLLGAGFSVDADRACIEQEIDLGRLWHTTRIGVAFNPYQVVQSVGRQTDETFTETMMQYCRVELGPQCVLENNSIRYPPLSGPYDSMYATMMHLGPPISFQTAASTRIGDLAQTLQWAVGEGADAVELPQGYQTEPPSLLSGIQASLQANPG